MLRELGVSPHSGLAIGVALLLLSGCIDDTMPVEARLACLQVTQEIQADVPNCKSQEECRAVLDRDYFSFSQAPLPVAVTERLDSYERSAAASWHAFNEARKRLVEIRKLCLQEKGHSALPRKVNEADFFLETAFEEADNAHTAAVEALALSRTALEEADVNEIPHATLYGVYVEVNDNLNSAVDPLAPTQSASFTARYTAKVARLRALSQESGFSVPLLHEITQGTFLAAFFGDAQAEAESRHPLTLYIPHLNDWVSNTLSSIADAVDLVSASNRLMQWPVGELVAAYDILLGANDSALKDFSRLMQQYAQGHIELEKENQERITTLQGALEQLAQRIDALEAEGLDTAPLESAPALPISLPVAQNEVTVAALKAQVVQMQARTATLAGQGTRKAQSLGTHTAALLKLDTEVRGLHVQVGKLEALLVDQKARCRDARAALGAVTQGEETLAACAKRLQEDRARTEQEAALAAGLSNEDPVCVAAYNRYYPHYIGAEGRFAGYMARLHEGTTQPRCAYYLDALIQALRNQLGATEKEAIFTKAGDLLTQLEALAPLYPELLPKGKISTLQGASSRATSFFRNRELDLEAALDGKAELEQALEDFYALALQTGADFLSGYLSRSAELSILPPQNPVAGTVAPSSFRISFYNPFFSLEAPMRLETEIGGSPVVEAHSSHVARTETPGNTVALFLSRVPKGITYAEGHIDLLVNAKVTSSILRFSPEQARLVFNIAFDNESSMPSLQASIVLPALENIQSISAVSAGQTIRHWREKNSVGVQLSPATQKATIAVYVDVSHPLSLTVEEQDQTELDANTLLKRWSLRAENRMPIDVPSTQASFYLQPLGTEAALRIQRPSGEDIAHTLYGMGRVRLTLPALSPGEGWSAVAEARVQNTQAVRTLMASEFSRNLDALALFQDPEAKAMHENLSLRQAEVATLDDAKAIAALPGLIRTASQALSTAKAVKEEHNELGQRIAELEQRAQELLSQGEAAQAMDAPLIAASLKQAAEQGQDALLTARGLWEEYAMNEAHRLTEEAAKNLGQTALPGLGDGVSDAVAGRFEELDSLVEKVQGITDLPSSLANTRQELTGMRNEVASLLARGSLEEATVSHRALVTEADGLKKELEKLLTGTVLKWKNKATTANNLQTETSTVLERLETELENVGQDLLLKSGYIPPFDQVDIDSMRAEWARITEALESEEVAPLLRAVEEGGTAALVAGLDTKKVEKTLQAARALATHATTLQNMIEAEAGHALKEAETAQAPGAVIAKAQQAQDENRSLESIVLARDALLNAAPENKHLDLLLLGIPVLLAAAAAVFLIQRKKKPVTLTTLPRGKK